MANNTEEPAASRLANLKRLAYFAAVVETGSFTAAAERLGISQSAVSHALKQLEGEWGVTLLSRSKAGIEVTEVGRNLLARAREILGISEAIAQEVAAVRGLNRGVLRIGSFGPSSSLLLLPRILDQYRRDYPEIEIHVDEGPDDVVANWIAERRVDVGFVVLPDERFDTQLLVEDQLVAVLPLGHPLARHDPQVDPGERPVAVGVGETDAFEREAHFVYRKLRKTEDGAQRPGALTSAGRPPGPPTRCPCSSRPWSG